MHLHRRISLQGATICTCNQRGNCNLPSVGRVQVAVFFSPASGKCSHDLTCTLQPCNYHEHISSSPLTRRSPPHASTTADKRTARIHPKARAGPIPQVKTSEKPALPLGLKPPQAAAVFLSRSSLHQGTEDRSKLHQQGISNTPLFAWIKSSLALRACFVGSHFRQMLPL